MSYATEVPSPSVRMFIVLNRPGSVPYAEPDVFLVPLENSPSIKIFSDSPRLIDSPESISKPSSYVLVNDY